MCARLPRVPQAFPTCSVVWKDVDGFWHCQIQARLPLAKLSLTYWLQKEHFLLLLLCPSHAPRAQCRESGMSAGGCLRRPESKISSGLKNQSGFPGSTCPCMLRAVSVPGKSGFPAPQRDRETDREVPNSSSLDLSPNLVRTQQPQPFFWEPSCDVSTPTPAYPGLAPFHAPARLYQAMRALR